MSSEPSQGIIVVFCKKCGARLRAPSSLAGQRGKCSQCGSALSIPFSSETAPPAGTGRPPIASGGGAPATARAGSALPRPMPIPKGAARQPARPERIPVRPAAARSVPPPAPAPQPPPAAPGAVVPTPETHRPRRTWLLLGLAAAAVAVAAVGVVGTVLIVGHLGGFSPKDSQPAAPGQEAQRAETSPPRTQGQAGGGPGAKDISASVQLQDRLSAEGRLPAMPGKIAGNVPVEVLSARLTRGHESLTYPWSGSLRTYSVRLVLRNTGREMLLLGNSCGVIEANADASSYEGMVQVRRPEPKAFGPPGLGGSRNMFLVSNYQENSDENRALLAVTGTLMTFSTGSCRNPSFGTLPPGERVVLVLYFKLGRILLDESLSTVWFVSPVVYIPGAKEAPACLLVWTFKRPAGVELDGKWALGPHQQVSLGEATLSDLAQGDNRPTFLRVAAIVWLTDLYGNKHLDVLRRRLVAFRESRGEVRAAAITALGQLRDTASVPVLRELLRNKDQPNGIRIRSAAALGDIGQPDAVDALAEAARSDKDVADSAITALGRLRGPKALEALRGLLAGNDEDPALKALGTMEEQGAACIPIVLGALQDKRDKVAARAATALGALLRSKEDKGRHTDRGELDSFSGLLGDEEARAAARAQALRSESPDLAAPECQTVLQALERALGDSRTGVRQAAARALGDAPGPAASAILIRQVSSVASPAPELLEALARRREPNVAALLRRFIRADASKEVCKAACDALGQLKAADARPELERILTAPGVDDQVPAAAYKALEHLEGGPSETALLAVAAIKKHPCRQEALQRLCDSTSGAARAAVRSAVAETDNESKWWREDLQKRLARQATRPSSRSLAQRLADREEEDRASAAREVAEKKKKEALADLKRALAAETAAAPMHAIADALVALECRDSDLVPPLLEKLGSKDKAISRAAADLLRYVTGIQNGPFDQETDAEADEDVAAWQAWAQRQGLAARP